MRNAQIPCLLILAAVLAGCSGSADRARPASAVRDSAGIRIVESAGPAWDEGSAWHLAGSPLLDLGRLDGPAETQFFRVSAATRLSDGSLVLGSFGSHDLRRFAASGEHLWTAGREGEGPGEFTGLTQIAAGPGDTILTYDFRQRRFSRFAPDGTFIDSRPLEGPSEAGFAFVEQLLGDGTAVFTWREFGRNEGPPAEGEVRRDTIGVWVLDSGGETRELGKFAGPEMVVLQSGETDGGFTISIGSTPFGRSTVVTGGTSGVWIGDTDRFEVFRYGTDGRLEEIARRSYDPVVVDDALIQRALDEELESADDDNDRRAARRRWEKTPVPETLPAFESLLVDRDGNLWAQAFEVPGEPQRTWSVFTPDGQWLGEVAVPDRFSPLEIGDDYVLGRFGDELDVEHIQVWELVKPAG